MILISGAKGHLFSLGNIRFLVITSVAQDMFYDAYNSLTQYTRIVTELVCIYLFIVRTVRDAHVNVPQSCPVLYLLF